MKKLLFLLLLVIVALEITAQEVEVIEKYIYHKISAVETDSGEPITSDVDMKDVIMFSKIENEEFLVISVQDIHTYFLTIVEKEEKLSENIRTRIFYGFESKGDYVATVFFFYDISKNELVPDNIWLRIEGSPNIIVFSGIIKLEK